MQNSVENYVISLKRTPEIKNIQLLSFLIIKKVSNNPRD